MNDDTDASRDDSQREADLHRRMMTGDPTATSAIAEYFMVQSSPTLTDWLRQRYLRLDDPALIDEAVEDALLEYFKQPEKFDHNIKRLRSYLRMAADRNLRNHLHPTRLQENSVQLSDFVELDPSGAEYEIEIKDEFDLEDYIADQTSDVRTRLYDVLPDDTDRKLVALMMDGIRETAAYAQVLEITHLPADEQAKEVKRHKDRVKKHLQRHLRPTEFRNE